MRILLAGYNIDQEIIRELTTEILEPVAQGWEEARLDEMSEVELRTQAVELQRRIAEFLSKKNLTPEPISAAYARISRDPRPLDELRAIARTEVEKARKSNQTIIFEYGHSSVAEHAIFNFDIIAVSRYAVEEIEKFRLLSYTEKSQRYILLEDDFVIPKEIKESGFEKRYVATIKAQNACYHTLYEKLRPWVFDQNPELAAKKRNHKTLEGWAKEDARYIVSLATETQVGMTLNARNLEHVISRCASHPLGEIQEYARRLYEAVEGIAPSLVKYIQPTDFHVQARPDLRDASEQVFSKTEGLPSSSPLGSEEDVALVDATPVADTLIAATLLHSSSHRPIDECLAAAQSMGEGERTSYIAGTFRHMKGFDSVLREFENVRCIFEITLSAACFGQLKRHRLATMSTQPYDPALGVTIPSAITQAGGGSDFLGVIQETNKVFKEISQFAPLAAPYVLTNAHRRKILFTANARELYHISRLREDPHAQWDVRDKAGKMLRLARKVMPGVLQFAVGKHQVDEVWAKLFPDAAKEKTSAKTEEQKPT